MNVLLLPSHFPTRRAPQQATYVYEYARSLALQHQVTIVYPEQIRSPSVGSEPFYIEEFIASSMRFVNYSYSHFPKSWLLSYLYAFRRIYARVRRDWKIDIIFAHVVQPAGLAAVMLGRLLKLPVVLLEHMGPARDWLEWSAYPRLLQYKTLQYTYGGVDYLAAVSSSLGNEITALFGAKVDGKLYNPVDCELFAPLSSQSRDTERRVLCVTRGHAKDWRKGIANLLGAWELVISHSQQPTYLDLVGERVEDLAAELERLGITRSCRLHPWVPAPELAQMMQRSALVVIPSAYETFGRSGVEALACGVPVVATRCGGPEEYIRPGTGLLVRVNDPQALAEGILTALERGNFLPPQELANFARTLFGYEAVCEQFTRVGMQFLDTAFG